MSLSEVVVEGTLKPDGTLELDEKPNLSPGRVTVVLRQEIAVSPLPQEDWLQFMQKSRQKMEEVGSDFMDENEVRAHIKWLREGDRIEDLIQEAKAQHQKPE